MSLSSLNDILFRFSLRGFLLQSAAPRRFSIFISTYFFDLPFPVKDFDPGCYRSFPLIPIFSIGWETEKPDERFKDPAPVAHFFTDDGFVPVFFRFVPLSALEPAFMHHFILGWRRTYDWTWLNRCFFSSSFKVKSTSISLATRELFR